MAKLLRSKIGEVMSEQEWRAWVDNFWDWAEKEHHPLVVFKRPKDYFERIVKILGLEEVSSFSYKGVF
jgi:hypothetical protein